MKPKADYIWMDGEIVPWDKAQVHLMTHTLHYGLGAFEGIRCYQTTNGRSAVFRLEDHIKRLFTSAKIGLMKIPYTQGQIIDACKEIVRRNKLPAAYLRPLVWMGVGSMGLGAADCPIHVAIMAFEWGAYLGAEGLKKGIRCKVSSFTRMHPNNTMAKAKITGQYVNSILSKREATMDGYDEAIMLDAQGYVTECSGENIFIVRDGLIKTTPTGGAILNGVTRDSVIQIAQESGLKIVQERFTRDELYIADEIFLTGTAAEITPVREVDRRQVADGQPGEITHIMQERFFRIVRGDDPKFSHWLNYLA